MKRRRKLLSILLSLALVIGMIPAFTVTASASNSLPNFKYTDNHLISWDHVTDATSYSVQLVEHPGHNYTMRRNDSDEWSYCNETDYGMEVDLQKLFDSKKIWPNDTYRISIIAYRNNTKMDYQNSITFTYVSTLKHMDDPANLKWNGTTVSWDPPDGAQRYRVFLYEVPGKDYINVSPWFTSPTYTFKDSLFSSSYNYYFSVEARADGYRNSNEVKSSTISGATILNGGSEEVQTRTVTFNANGGSGSMDPMIIPYGGWLKFPECTFTPPAGATFAGWKLSYRDSVYDPGNSVTIYSDTIYYAIWEGGSVVNNDVDTHYVNTGALNMRARPDANSERIGGLKKGDLVMLLDSDGEWFKISYRGLIGWVQSQYLELAPYGEWEDPFNDITKGSYDYVPILWAYNTKPQVTTGITATRFGPKETVTRGQCVTFLWRAMGEPEPKNKNNPFVDVPESEYYYKPILWAVEKGITKGTDSTHFSPNQKLSTAHIITFLYRTLGKGSDGWYQEAGNWAASNSLMDRTGLTVSPNVDCPRGAVVTFLYRTK